MRAFSRLFLVLAAILVLMLACSSLSLAANPPKKTPEELGLVLAPYEEGYEVTGYTGQGEELNLTRLIIDKPILRIGEGAFKDSMIKRIRLPNSLRSLGEEAFSYSTIQSVAFPSQVTTIPRRCFADCMNFRNVKFGKNLQRIEAFAFQGCQSLEFAEIPTSLTYLGESAFEGTKIRQIILPAGITEIPDKCFYTCSNLTSIQFKGYLTRIGAYAFGYCTKIGEFALQRFDATLTELGEGAFSNTFLSFAPIPSRITVIPDRCFENCKDLQNVTLPDGLVRIGDSAFSGCRRLGFGKLPGTVTEIGENAFAGSKMTKMVFPAGVSVVRKDLLYGCEQLYYVEFHEGITTIEDRAFFNCPTLKKITIPETVTSLGKSAFSGCSWLLSADIRANIDALPNGFSRIAASLQP